MSKGTAILLALLTSLCCSSTLAAGKPLKVYILAGQSNMQGSAHQRTLAAMGNDPQTAKLLSDILDQNGHPIVCDNTWITYLTGDRDGDIVHHGKVKVGYGFDEERIGPEYGFGLYIDKALDEPVLIIKAAWGGKSLAVDFRPPSAGPYEPSAAEKERGNLPPREQVGRYYRKVIRFVRSTLKDAESIRRVVPDYNPEQSYELAGFVWFQGWNDMCNRHHLDQYTENMIHFISDIRKDLGAPTMPFIVGILGVYGTEPDSRKFDKGLPVTAFREAQFAAVEQYDQKAPAPYRGNVIAVDSGPYYELELSDIYWKRRLTSDWKRRLKQGEMSAEKFKEECARYGFGDGELTAEEQRTWDRCASNAEYHYLGSGKTFVRFGKALAEAMLTATPSLAPTPPMGWNSWNCFQKEIDEKKIRAIADVMVRSGMREAGYVYLVLDDAWMAKTRDEKGRLQADPEKFPNGMKAIGDYIHGKGLKFGIYQDRGKWTCQQLPGSFGHEQIDMQTFAEWGVDYIKLDSCFAESNGRMSSEDYAIYRKYIQATGRPIVLSISDFGNAAWAWGGKESAQLWRTSGDIYPWMGSVYHCAGTSSHDLAIHPAFNGLWQFAGPGHWNDPDMLQVGNLKNIPDNRKRICDRTHFGLWCILAAPLMAGNDLRTMSAEVQSVLTAPELIAVNQDPRGAQGYLVFNRDGCEIYNKPLADGTAAVMLLNKGREPADVTVHWAAIGLSGSQPVRDLWARKDLGEFNGHFTAKGLTEHEHRMIKAGRPGPPLPMPAPMPLDKYTVTRSGETQLSDLYYIWKAHNAPVYNGTFNGEPIIIGEQTFTKGFGCRAKSAFMFMVNGRADRFKAVVAVDKSSADNAKGRFRVYHGGFFANKVLWDSRDMTAASPAKEIDIELEDVRCLMLVFDGDKSLGNWANPRVTAE